MFEQKLEKMTATVFIESGLFQTLISSNVAALPVDGSVCEGANLITSDQAISLISRVDRALGNCPKYLRVRVRSFRNGLVCAFGPEMEERVGLVK